MSSQTIIVFFFQLVSLALCFFLFCFCIYWNALNISCYSFKLLIVPICCLNNIITKYEFSFCLRLRSFFVLARHSLSHSIAFHFFLFSYPCVRLCICCFFSSFIRSFCLYIRSSLPSLNSHKLLYFIWLSDDMTIDWRRKFSVSLYARFNFYSRFLEADQCLHVECA